ncbi:MAG TPA: transcription antitermination factor NusB [Candidatus Aphodovivens avistercoris]|nr:transcription antitermination factor NusB [Candidatus Aphodovivens avistercoris]
MAAKRHQRTAARRAALALLYTSEITEEYATSIAEEGRALEEAGPLTDYAQQLVRGVEAHIAAIDRELASTSENWSVSRMPIVDRSILRLAVYEMMFVDDVPTSVCINEAIELAKDFGGEDESPRFINGVLGRIARRLEGEQGDAAPADADAAPAGEAEAAAEAPEAEDAADAGTAADAAEGEARGV